MEPLAERAEELAILDGLFEDCLFGCGKVVFVSGGVATGKTALLHTFTDRVADSGAVFLSAFASYADRALPLAVIAQLADDLDFSFDDSQHQGTMLRASILSATQSAVGSKEMNHITTSVARELWRTVRYLAERRPVVIGVDDVHYADPQSMQVLLYVVRRLSLARIFMILNGRVTMDPADMAFRAELCRSISTKIRLYPLSLQGVAIILAQRLGQQAAERLAPVCHEFSGGNPLLVRALLEDCRSSAIEAATELVIGDAFRQSVLSCLHRCGETVLSVARAVALLGRSTTPPLIGGLVDLRADSVTCALGSLQKMGLLSAGDYRCDDARNAVLACMSTQEQRFLHGRAARLLYDDGAAGVVVVRHLTAADIITTPWVVSVLEDATEQALLDHDVDLSRSCLRLANEVCVDEQRRVNILAATTWVEWLVSPSAVARRLHELCAALYKGNLLGRQAVRLVGYLVWHGKIDEAMEVFERLRDVSKCPPLASKSDLDEIQLWLTICFPERFSCGKENNYIIEHGNTFRETADPVVSAPRLLASVLIGNVNENVVVSAEEILQICHLDDGALAPIVATLASLIYTNNLENAASWCSLLLNRAARVGVPLWQAVLESVHARICFLQGDLITAHERAHKALNLLSPKGWGIAVGVPLGSMVLTATAMGKYEDAADLLAVPVPEIMFETLCGLSYLHARGRYYLATGNCYAALADFERCRHSMTQWGIDLSLVPWRIDEAQAFLRLGRITQARELAEAQLFALGEDSSVSKGVALRVVAKCADMVKRTQLLRQAADVLQACGDRLELAVTLADLSRSCQAMGQRGAARIYALHAYRLAQQCGAQAMARGVLQDFGPVIAEPPSHEDAPVGRMSRLSDSEQRVALLVTEGYTNRQIAKRLFITISTVEQHLTRVYRKLGVQRRNDLAAALAVELSEPTADWRVTL